MAFPERRRRGSALVEWREVPADLRQRLLELHGAIVAIEREDYERKAGRVDAADFLRLLVEDRAWDWLRPLSTLIVQFETEEGVELRKEARSLLRPDSAGSPFQQRYAWLIERSPDVAFAHGRVMQALKTK